VTEIIKPNKSEKNEKKKAVKEKKKAAKDKKAKKKADEKSKKKRDKKSAKVDPIDATDETKLVKAGDSEEDMKE
jgi:hypothetical protein